MKRSKNLVHSLLLLCFLSTFICASAQRGRPGSPGSGGFIGQLDDSYMDQRNISQSQSDISKLNTAYDSSNKSMYSKTEYPTPFIQPKGERPETTVNHALMNEKFVADLRNLKLSVVYRKYN